VKRFRVVGKLKKQTVKALGPCTEWDSIISRLTLPTEGGAGDGYHPNLVFMVQKMMLVETNVKMITGLGDDYARELRREVGAKWAEVCGVGAAHEDVVLFQHIAAIMEALVQIKKRKRSHHFNTVHLVGRFVRKHNRLPFPREIAEEMVQMGGSITTGRVREYCELVGIILPVERGS